MTSLRAEVTLGLLTRDGLPVEKTDVLRFLADQATGALNQGFAWLPFVVADVVIAYAKDGKGCLEPALTLTSDRNPRYNAALPEEEWKSLVEATAKKLRDRFFQERVYVTYLPAEIKVL